MNISFDKPAGILIKTTCVDYPGMLAGSFFLKGCNLRCPYCYNTELVTEKNTSENDKPVLNSLQELFTLMEKRKGLLKGIVISGGEPLLNPHTPFIIKKAKEEGYKVKLDTNGTLPEKLEQIVHDSTLKPDFIAMDIKTSPERYSTELCSIDSPFYANTEYFVKAIHESIKLVSEYKTENREFRTVLVPYLVTKTDIVNISHILPEDSNWQFAEFKNGNCLNPEYNKVLPYSDKETAELIKLAKEKIKGAALR